MQLTPDHLTPDYWLEKTPRPAEPARGRDWIAAFNARSVKADPHLVDLPNYPETVEGAELKRLIQSVSKPHETELFYHDAHGGGRLEASDYARYRQRMALESIPDTVNVRFGLILQRSNMRSWPTREFVFRSPETRDLDRFQENGLFPGEAVAVLHESSNGKWLFVRSYNYHAWVRSKCVVLGERREVMRYAESEPFLVVTGARASTNYNPVDESVSEVVLDMGARLPLTKAEELPAHVDGQNPVASYAVQMPVRRDEERLGFKTVLIARGQDVREGYLPLSRENAIRQAFKFLGERYGWGHSYNARDCTGLVLEVYRSMGILLPRNSSQQGSSPIGENIRFDENAGADERMRALRGCGAGDLLYSPGHVMMLLGFEGDEPWVIHDMSGSGWVDENGDPVDGVMNGVAATPLTTTKVTPEETYFQQIYAIKKIL